MLVYRIDSVFYVKQEISKENSKKSRTHRGFDPLPSEGRLYQKNEGGWNFRLLESDCKSKVLLDVPVGRYMDLSLIDIDVQPTWVRILVKGKLLQLLLPEEVNPDASIAQRSATTGNLLISMPKASSNARVNVQKCNSSPLFYTSQAEEQGKEKSGAWSKVNAVKNMERANALMEQPVKKELVSSKILNEEPEIEQEQQLDEHTFDNLPALE